MGFRFQRRVKILPGVHLNFSRSGMGVSFGPRGLKLGVDGKGRQYSSVGIPGTGISQRNYVTADDDGHMPAEYQGAVVIGLLIAAALVVLVLVVASMQN